MCSLLTPVCCSSQRRKNIIEDLRKTVSKLANDSEEQRKTIAKMQERLEKAHHENELLRLQVTAMHQSIAAPPEPQNQSSDNEILELLRELAAIQQRISQPTMASTSTQVNQTLATKRSHHSLYQKQEQQDGIAAIDATQLIRLIQTLHQN